MSSDIPSLENLPTFPQNAFRNTLTQTSSKEKFLNFVRMVALDNSAYSSYLHANSNEKTNIVVCDITKTIATILLQIPVIFIVGGLGNFLFSKISSIGSLASPKLGITFLLVSLLLGTVTKPVFNLIGNSIFHSIHKKTHRGSGELETNKHEKTFKSINTSLLLAKDIILISAISGFITASIFKASPMAIFVSVLAPIITRIALKSILACCCGCCCCCLLMGSLPVFLAFAKRSEPTIPIPDRNIQED